MTNQLDLTISKIIPAPRNVVFEAWLDPKALSKFMLPNVGMSVPKAESDARVGGNFLIVMKAGEQEIPHRGEYRVIDRYERLVFTWLSEFSSPDSTVTLTFEALDDERTKLTLHHIGFPSEESRDNHEGGWSSIVDKLATTVS